MVVKNGSVIEGRGENCVAFFYYANIVGYVRFVLLIASCWFMPNRQWIAASCYLFSAALDLIDGTIARLFNQSSKLGAILDTLADRCADMCLLSCLCTFYVDYMFLFMMIMLLDISSHWIHVHSYMADAGRSHKDIDSNCPYLLRLYYTNKMFLTTLSSSNEVFFTLLYLCHFTYGPKVAFGVHLFPLLAIVTGPPTCSKIVINALQFWSAAKKLALLDGREKKN
ncbi:hypothetical protein CRM22_002140 [Opisthorchis felineus]|uniref:CDP-diacylglycerol--inositol 3-phosphatidyltransferase n=1 Tax=Opisthorchis felineus TaxID=147828 RepID=A0A4S2MBU5_OPIFE|nr:hypothetical protein CRM22_002140 [Opisthorchis felineus]